MGLDDVLSMTQVGLNHARQHNQVWALALICHHFDSSNPVFIPG
jgi:hypothetical protein